MGLTRRQRQVLDFIKDFIEQKGYSPSLEEIGRHFGLSSVATVHKHVTNLVRKGLLRRSWNQNRSIEVVGEEEAPRAIEVPVRGRVVSGRPVETGVSERPLSLPGWLVGVGHTYGLRVADGALGGALIAEGDLLVIEERRVARPGETVVAHVRGEEVALYRCVQQRAGRHLLPVATGEAEPVPLDDAEVRGVVRGVVRRC